MIELACLFVLANIYTDYRIVKENKHAFDMNVVLAIFIANVLRRLETKVVSSIILYNQSLKYDEYRHISSQLRYELIKQ